MRAIFIGCAGWGLPKNFRHQEKTHYLRQYAHFFNCVEINSSFYKIHKEQTYEKWRNLVPEDFKFSVKIPRSVSHETQLKQPELLMPFLLGVKSLGASRGPLLLQTPPKLAFDAEIAKKFFAYLKDNFDGEVVFEPRHASWFQADAHVLLFKHNIDLVRADPGLHNPFSLAHSECRTQYIRLHGSPQIYYSAYSQGFLTMLANRLAGSSEPIQTWIIFDNTALGHAFDNAIKLQELLVPENEDALKISA
jgi:uncharacterized protein YecE (DUF72 family)